MRQYGCVMLNIPIRGWTDILACIDPDDVYDPDGDHGLSLYPHVTVLYGVHQMEKPLDMMLFIDQLCRQVTVKFGAVEAFTTNPDFDVLKFGIKANGLGRYHNKIRNAFSCTEDYPDYSPHLTIAYLKKGTWHKYKKLKFDLPEINVDLMRFTNADGHETLIKLRPNE